MEYRVLLKEGCQSNPCVDACILVVTLVCLTKGYAYFHKSYD